MDLEVRHLKLVVAIAEEGGVTRAGEKLHLTQSALSHQLKDIEERLGAPLFHRSGKRMLLTQAGEKLLASARSLLAQLESVEAEIRSHASEKKGTIRLSTECYTCYHWLPVLLGRFRKSYPEVEVKILLEANSGPVDALLKGGLDLAILMSDVKDRRIHLTPLFQDELLAVMSPGHRLASRPFVRPSDFAEENLYIYSTPENSFFIQGVLRPAGVMPKQVSQAPLTEAIVHLVEAGLGIAAMARWAIAPELRAGVVKGVPITRSGFHRQWSAARLRSRHEPAYLRAFVDLLAQDPMGVLAKERRRSSAASA
jgi:LysR family transcriptional regulator for metE and metH